MQFDIEVERLRFALIFVNHELNEIREEFLASAEELFLQYDKGTEITSNIVRSPSRLPVDPRFSTKKARAANMIPFGPARRTRQALRRNAV